MKLLQPALTDCTAQDQLLLAAANRCWVEPCSTRLTVGVSAAAAVTGSRDSVHFTSACSSCPRGRNITVEFVLQAQFDQITASLTISRLIGRGNYPHPKFICRGDDLIIG